MKKRIVLLLCFALILCAGYFSSHFYTTMKVNVAKEKMLERNPAISTVEEVTTIGAWGEWFSEYTAVVERNGQMYRIWMAGDGEITEMEKLE